MSFQWPFAFALVLLVPVVLGVYLWKLRRRRKQAVRYSSVALLRSVIPARSRRRRHIPVALLLTSVGVLAFASSRPEISRTVPFGRTSVILALDVSQSMCATDVDPNRLTVAQEAARAFIKNQADGSRMGIVMFSGFAQLVVPPTTDRDVLLAAIDGLTTARGTAIGSAILKSLDAIAETNPNVTPVGDTATGNAPAADVGEAGANGFASDIVVLLTDGANTRGVAPLDAVPYAIERGVRVFTIGFGTATPASMSCTRQQLGADALGGGGGFGGGGGQRRGGGGFGGGAGSPLVADESTLQKVADQTGGKYYKAEDAEQLADVFTELPKDVDLQEEQTEITAAFAGLGALLAAAAVVTSIRWSPYP